MTLIPLIPKPVGELNRAYHRKTKYYKKLDKFKSLYIKNRDNGTFKHVIKYKNSKIKSINYNNKNLKHGYYKEWNKEGKLIIKDFYYKSKLLIEFDVTGMKTLKEQALCHYILNNKNVSEKDLEIISIY